MNITTYEDVKKLLYQTVSDEFRIEDIKFTDELIFTLKLSGNKWDGYVDYEIANFVINIQSTIDQLYKQLKFDTTKYKRVLREDKNNIKIKIRLDFGCSLIKVNIGKAFNYLFKNMSGKQKVFLCTSFCFIISSTLYGISYNDSLVELERIKAENEHKQELIQTIDKAIEQLGHVYNPINNLTKAMDEDDFIEFKNSDKKYPKNQIRLKVEPTHSKEVEKSSHYVDGKYELLRIYKDSDEVCIKIDNYQLMASTEPLRDRDKALMHDVFKKAHLENTIAYINLHVVVAIKNGSFVNAYVVGIGSPRKESLAIHDALVLPPKVTPEQLPLIRLSNK